MQHDTEASPAASVLICSVPFVRRIPENGVYTFQIRSFVHVHETGNTVSISPTLDAPNILATSSSILVTNQTWEINIDWTSPPGVGPSSRVRSPDGRILSEAALGTSESDILRTFLVALGFDPGHFIFKNFQDLGTTESQSFGCIIGFQPVNRPKGILYIIPIKSFNH